MVELEMGPYCIDIDECAESEKRGEPNPCGEAKCVNKEEHYECMCDDDKQYHHMGKCMDKEQVYDYTSPFSEMGQCYSNQCYGESLGQVSYATCCCEIGNRWEADFGNIVCDECPVAGSSAQEELCGNLHLNSASSSVISASSSIDNPEIGACYTERNTFEDVTFEECCCATSLMPIEWGHERRPCTGLHYRTFYTQCPSGKGSIEGRDIDECQVFGGDKLCVGGACINQIGGFACTCQEDGYYWEEGKCVNFNECTLKGTYCVGGKCTDTDGSYHCECPPGEEEIDATCQPRHNMMANLPIVPIVDFEEPSTCYVTENCDEYYIYRRDISQRDCCCDNGLSWGTKDQCFECSGQDDRLKQLCHNWESPNELFDTDEVYPTEEIYPTVMPTYDNIDEFEYDDMDTNRPFSDQPKRPKLPTGGRAAPVSVNVEEKIITTNKAFSCGLPGGCGHGSCIQSPRGVKCRCHKGWKKTRQGKCIVRL